MSEEEYEGYEIYIAVFLLSFAIVSVAIYDYSILTSSFWYALTPFGVDLTYQPYVKPEVVVALAIILVGILLLTAYSYRKKLFVSQTVVVK